MAGAVTCGDIRPSCGAKLIPAAEITCDDITPSCSISNVESMKPLLLLFRGSACGQLIAEN